MKLSSFVQSAALVMAVGTLGCQEARPAMPTAASIFISDLGGVWAGPMTLAGSTGGECAGAVVDTFLPVNDRGTVSVSQNGSALLATMTTESTGLACRYSGSATVGGLALNSTSCDRTGLIVQCLNGQARELRLVGSSVSATVNGGRITGTVSSTYNVFTAAQPQEGVGSLIANHNFTGAPR